MCNAKVLICNVDVNFGTDDGQCEECGFPFDRYQRIYETKSGDLVCSSRCVHLSEQREMKRNPPAHVSEFVSFVMSKRDV